MSTPYIKFLRMLLKTNVAIHNEVTNRLIQAGHPHHKITEGNLVACLLQMQLQKPPVNARMA